MRELDELLLGYLNRCYGDAEDDEKQAFHALLELPDPDLVAYLLQQEPAASGMQRVVARILDRTNT